jgi:hypothetical protein
MVTQAAGCLVDAIASHLGHPRLGRMPRDAGQCRSPGLQMQKEEDVIGDETAPCQDLDRKKVRSGQDSHMRRDELFPSSLLAALWRRCDAVAFQDIPDRLIGDVMTEVGERADMRS